MIYVILYLITIVLANLLVTLFGVRSVYFVSFFLVGFDLTCRDKLHEKWHNKGLVWKMGLLIGCGSLISYAINQSSRQIALASFIAFICAALVDTLIFQILLKKHYLIKVNGSNLFSSLVDSLIFPTIAFGSIMPLVTLGQFLAKLLGGFLWSLVLSRKHNAK